MAKTFNLIKFKPRTDITSLPVTPFVIVDKSQVLYFRFGTDVVFKKFYGTVEDLLNDAKDALSAVNKTDKPSFILWDKGTMLVAFYKGETLSATYNLVLKQWLGVIVNIDVQFTRINKVGLCYDFITHVDKYDDLGGTC